MGQYYKPINLEKKQWIYTHRFKQGMKLMEHSYIGNHFVEAVEILLTKFGPWYKSKLVWAGDYADVEKETMKKGDEDSGENLFSLIDDSNGIESLAPYQIDKIKEKNKIDLKDYPFIVNHSKKVYVDKRKVKEFDGNWKIHPLPLLTCEGNGRGGGDYGGENEKLVGLWARDSISIEKKAPKEYHELEINFKEVR